jgi:hypothetical protein
MSAGNEQEAPKLIIDSDWKSQARQEKEKLSQKVEAPKAQGVAGAEGAPGETPTEPGIQDIVSLLMTQALTYMGAFPDPRTGRAVVSLEMARVFIELLKVLEDKTKGNLTEQEATVMSRVLNELRMEYVEMSKYLEQAIAEGKVKPVSQAGPGGVVAPPTGVAAPGMPKI